MDTELLRKLGNLDQIAGIRESRLLCGRGEGIRLAEFYTAAGLRFSVVPDRCMDLYDLSYKGVNLAFHSKNGLTSAQLNSAMDGEFFEQWPGGAMVTCGLDNVGGPCAADGCTYPTHGRIGSTPASSFGTESFWQDGRYVLRASGEIHQTRLYGRHLSIRRTIETGLQEKTIRIHDVITNFEAHDEPYMLLYHCNFGYPLLQADSVVETSRCKQSPMNEISFDPAHMTEPADDREEELFFRTGFGPEAAGITCPTCCNGSLCARMITCWRSSRAIRLTTAASTQCAGDRSRSCLPIPAWRPSWRSAYWTARRRSARCAHGSTSRSRESRYEAGAGTGADRQPAAGT